jgi:hypothetical protein
MKRKMRIDDVGPGMFSNEKAVSFEISGKHYTLLAPAHTVDEAAKELDVEVIAERGDQLIVDLPRETFTTGNRISIPRDRLVGATPVASSVP